MMPILALGRSSRLLKFAMPKPNELVTCHFPLWKRGTKGDLPSVSARKRLKSSSIPPSARSGQALFQRGKQRTEIACQTHIVNFNKLLGRLAQGTNS